VDAEGVLIHCPMCKQSIFDEDADLTCRHPHHWPDRDPERPYFPELVITYAGPSEAAHAAREAIVGHYVDDAGPIAEAVYVLACWAAEVQNATRPGELVEVVRRWVSLR
jgi:hypothetical protein